MTVTEQGNAFIAPAVTLGRPQTNERLPKGIAYELERLEAVLQRIGRAVNEEYQYGSSGKRGESEIMRHFALTAQQVKP